MELKYTGLLTHETYIGVTIIVEAHYGFNYLILLVILWTVQYCLPAGTRFTFNYYKIGRIFFCVGQGVPSVTLLRQEGVTQGDPLSIILYIITLVALA